MTWEKGRKMGKERFLLELRNYLSGEIPDWKVTENISYYDAYIEDEKKSGKTEEEILAHLGDPRLLAKTIIDAFSSAKGKFYQQNRESRTAKSGTDSGSRFHTKTGKSWIKKVRKILLICLILFFCLTIGGALLQLMFSVIIPVLCFIWIWKIMISIFRK